MLLNIHANTALRQAFVDDSYGTSVSEYEVALKHWRVAPRLTHETKPARSHIALLYGIAA